MCRVRIRGPANRKSAFKREMRFPSDRASLIGWGLPATDISKCGQRPCPYLANRGSVSSKPSSSKSFSTAKQTDWWAYNTNHRGVVVRGLRP
ncbi:hypothetical protein NL676_028997 [Syzygium grande]|nr:hypothetical protein NL676_028997 [Syzygium grande]